MDSQNDGRSQDTGNNGSLQQLVFFHSAAACTVAPAQVLDGAGGEGTE
jgi:hypothetical protein